MAETKEESIRYFKMALALAQVAINDFTAELIIDTWDEIERKGGKFNIEDAVRIEWNLRKKYRTVQAIEVKEETETTI
jgi:hypothetical protein